MTDIRNALVADALSNCMVIGNKINFFKNFTEEEVRLIYAKLTEDLFAYKIPHYRVIGFRCPVDRLHTTSVVKKNETMQMSIIKLAENLANIVPIELGGIGQSNSFVYSDTPKRLKEYTERLDIFRSAEQIPEWKRKKLPFEFDPNQIGQLMYPIGIFGEHDLENAIMSTRTLMYKEEKWMDALEKPRPKFLVDNVEVADSSNSNIYTYPADFDVFYYKGTGVLDFSQTADFFKYDSGVFPCRTTYDLCRFLTVRYPMSGETDGLFFYSPKGNNFNTFNFTTILKDYAKGLQVEE